MGFLSVLLPWGILLQVLAVLHFIRRRPDTFWLWIIIFFGPPGAFIYILMEVVPDLGLLRQSFEGFGRRKRISYLEALVLQNPAAGNYEELGDLYLDEGKFARARECYDKAITPRTADLDPVYRRGIAKIQMGEFAAAIRGPRTRDITRAEIRLAPGARSAGARVCEYRTASRRRVALSARTRALHALGDILQLRVVPGRAEASGRGARVGRAHPRQEANHAAIPAASRAAVVPEGRRAVEAPPEGWRLWFV